MIGYKAAAIQMNSQPVLEKNFRQAERLIKKAHGEGAEFISLPENFAFLGDFDKRIKNAEKICTETESFLKEIAGRLGIYLLGGSFPVPARNGKVYNRSIMIDPDGQVAAQYDKIHLFDVDLGDDEIYRESDYVEAGNPETVLFLSENIGNIGLSVCYDLRFPELYRSLSAKGAEILTIPSAFTKKTGRVHWEVLLKARAVENTCYVVAPAQTGVHGKKRETYGHGMIIDPWGNVLGEGGTEPEIITAEIDFQLLEEIRDSMPSLKHRRL